MGTFYLKKYRIRHMKHLLTMLLLFLPFQLFGFDFKSISADYDVSYGLFGEVGTSHADLSIEDGTYKIRIVAEGKGLTKFFSQGRKEVYESTGIVKNGQFLPSLFVKNRTWGSKEDRKRYFFNHDKKEIVVIKTDVNGGKVKESRETLPYYARNDILTLFFNLRQLIDKDLVSNKKIQLYAVGANHKDGHLSVEVPDKKMKSVMKKLLKKDDNLLIVILNQKLFASKRGEFFINITDKGLCDRVVLKDIVMYGDLVGKMKNLKIVKR